MLGCLLLLAQACGHPAKTAVASADERIVLTPSGNDMVVVIRVPKLHDQLFATGIPETIASREGVILNHPEVNGRLTWQGPDAAGCVSTEWTVEQNVKFSVRLVPFDDCVEYEIAIENLGESTWHEVFTLNCLLPQKGPEFKDWTLARTYMSMRGEPTLLSKTTRVKGPMPTVGCYLNEKVPPGLESPFVRGFMATSPDRTDGEWLVTLSKDGSAYMAATAFDSRFLFDNLDRCCLHSAPDFGEIGPGQRSEVVGRLYFAKGGLKDFLERHAADRVELAPRQRRAAAAAGGGEVR
jgi:hypothetical protein